MLAQPRHVCGRQHASPAARLCSWRVPFPAVGSVRVDPVEHSRAQTLDLLQAPRHVPSPLSPPLVQHVEEPVAGNGFDLDLASLRPTAAGLVSNEYSGWGGWRCCGGTESLGVGELFVCERPVDGFSWSPPGQALQADTMRKLVVLEDVVLKKASQSCCQLGRPTDRRRLTGGQLRPTVRATAARSVRTSSSEEASRSTDEDERLLTKRSHGKHFTGGQTRLGGKAEKS